MQNFVREMTTFSLYCWKGAGWAMLKVNRLIHLGQQFSYQMEEVVSPLGTLCLWLWGSLVFGITWFFSTLWSGAQKTAVFFFEQWRPRGHRAPAEEDVGLLP